MHRAKGNMLVRASVFPVWDNELPLIETLTSRYVSRRRKIVSLCQTTSNLCALDIKAYQKRYVKEFCNKMIDFVPKTIQLLLESLKRIANG